MTIHFFIQLLYSTNIRTITLLGAHCLQMLDTLPPPRSEPSPHTLHMLCIHCNNDAFYQGLLVAFEAILISMYIHC